jgi:isoleucyl-tRNA synthetase
VYAVIWTTTPWTIPANQALNVHPEFEYSLVRTDRGTLLLASDLKEASLKRFALQRKEPNALDPTTAGRNLEIIRFRHPFYDRIAPI